MVTLPRFRSPGSHLTPRTQMDVEEGSLSFRAPGRGEGNPRKSSEFRGRGWQEDAIPESAGETEQWGREDERTLDPLMDPNRSSRVEMQS